MIERDKQEKPKPSRRNPLEWRSFPYWYLLLMMILLWAWQGAMQLTVKEVPYSEFKNYLQRDEVIEAEVHDTSVRGKVKPKDAAKEFLFRTVRIEDPKLVEELEAHHVKFTGVRP